MSGQSLPESTSATPLLHHATGHDHEDGESPLGDALAADETFVRDGVSMIPMCVTAIAAFWQKRGRSPISAPIVLDDLLGEKRVIGRNDPCPCGSGRKFKKCCGRDG